MEDCHDYVAKVWKAGQKGYFFRGGVIMMSVLAGLMFFLGLFRYSEAGMVTAVRVLLIIGVFFFLDIFVFYAMGKETFRIMYHQDADRLYLLRGREDREELAGLESIRSLRLIRVVVPKKVPPAPGGYGQVGLQTHYRILLTNAAGDEFGRELLHFQTKKEARRAADYLASLKHGIAYKQDADPELVVLEDR